MNKRLKYILFILFLQLSDHLISKEIQIDSGFSSIDIYNTLTNPTCSKRGDVFFDLQFKNNSGTDKQLYISFINPTIDKIEIYQNNDSVTLGDLVQFTKRKFKHINHVYPVFIKRDSTQQVRIVVYDRIQHALNFRVNISSENTFIRTTNHDNFFNGIFFGILFMYLMLLICFYIFSRSNFFTIYLMINFFMLLLFFQYNGTGNQFIWFYSSAVQKYITIIAVIGYLTSHILFVRTFFAVQFRTDYAKFFIRIFIFILIIFGTLLLAQLYNRSYGYVYINIYYLFVNGIFLLYGFLVIGLCIYTYRESRSREIIWVLIGMIFHITNWMIFINNEFAILKWLNYIDNFKLFPSNIFIPQMNYFITMIEMFVITIFISINYHKLIRQNNLSSQRLDFLQKRNINTFVLGQEEEREKISNEIEGDISKDIQQLSASLSKFKLQQDEKKIIPTVLDEISKTLADIKNITGNYVAPDMQQMKLQELITTATDKLFHEVNTHYDFTKIPDNFQLNAVANINLYRIFQEISNNTLKHSAAKNVTITAIKDNKTLQLKISDDGVGFTGNTNKSKGIGLMNIESRMNSLNGNFYLLSNENKGTTIHLIITLKEIT